MKANETSFLPFLQGPKQFLVPIFQRRYSWEKKHCQRLWDDIMRIGANPGITSHFLGSIVYMQPGVGNISTVPEFLVIDGQQRLTTLSLLLLALGEAIVETGSEIGISPKQLSNYYLFNADEEGELRYKQLLTRHDKETLLSLLERREPADASHRLVENYAFFEAKLRRADLDVVFTGITKLMVVDIVLNREHDNPQLIFESLNSTGLSLSQADLIRNYVLMGQDLEFQERIYEEYWFPMERRFGKEYAKKFDRFIRDYLTLKMDQIPNVADVYDSFKMYVPSIESQAALERVIAEIARYSEYYVRIALLQEDEPELHACFEDIQELRVEVAFPFLLGVYEDWTQGHINKTELIEILRLVEGYVFRRAICGIPTNSLNKTFAALMQEVDKSNYLESVKVAFSRMASYRRYPRDYEFRQEFLVKDVYNFRGRNYLLRKLENHERKEPVPILAYTIEHVMPQTLSEDWEDELGENFRDAQEKYLHTAGNLTLTGYNPELSNRPFHEKQDMEGGFRDSPLRLNRSLAQAEKWDEEAIRERAKELAEKALKIWVYPEV